MFYPTLLKAIEKEDFDDVATHINNQANVNVAKGHYYTDAPLHTAVNLGNEDIVELLIKANADINLKNCFKDTPLQCAVKRRNLNIIKLLIDAGADVNSRDGMKKTALHCVTERNCIPFESLSSSRIDKNIEDYFEETVVEIAKILIDSVADVNCKDSEESTVLLAATKSFNIKLVKFLISRGADPNIKNCNNKTAINIAFDRQNDVLDKIYPKHIREIKDKFKKKTFNLAFGRANIEFIKVLIDAGADIDTLTDKKGKTGFHLAVLKSNAELVGCFLTQGITGKANVNSKDKYGRTPLYYAVKEKNLELVRSLLNFGADPNIASNRGEVLIISAIAARNIEVVQMLIDHGSDINYIEPESKLTPFHHMCADTYFSVYNIELIKSLLSRGIVNKATINLQDMDGETPLNNLIRNQVDCKIIELMLKLGANVNIADKNGEVSLITAIKAENIEIVQMLCDHGSNVNYVNPKNGFTPLHYVCGGAYKFKHSKEIIKYLLETGAKLDISDLEGNTPLRTALRMTCYDGYKLENFNEMLTLLLTCTDFSVVDSHDTNIFLKVETKNRAWKIILEHIAQLQALDFHVDSSLLEAISKHTEFNYYFNKCTNELLIAKKTKLHNSWITFFNLLVDSSRKLKNYAGNEDMVRDFKKSDCKKKFRIYGASMCENFIKGIQKRELFDKSVVLLSNSAPIYNPTHLIIQDTMNYMTTKELSKFCQTNLKRVFLE